MDLQPQPEVVPEVPLVEARFPLPEQTYPLDRDHSDRSAMVLAAVPVLVEVRKFPALQASGFLPAQQGQVGCR